MKRVRIDLLALVAIAFAIVITHLPMIGSGMCFHDPSWYFHFGNRVNHGDVPYRDFVFQVGPLPIYVDAAFQQLFGTKYVASLYAGLLVKILRVYAVWLVARRLAGWEAATLLAVFCALDPIFAYVHHWSTPWADLFVTLAGFCMVLAARTSARLAARYLALAGFAGGLVVAARQSTAVLVALCLVTSSAFLLWRRDSMTPRRLLAIGAGLLAGFATVFGFLAAAGALGPAIQQMFVDAPGKKGIHGIAAMLDAISGGAIAEGRFGYVTGFLVFLGLPSLVVAGIVVGAARDRTISTATVALLAAPSALAIVVLARDVSFELLTDLPRMFLTAVTALAVIDPVRLRRWFGIEPLIAIGLGALPLVSDWALEMSAPGRGWTHISALVTGALLVTLASFRVAQRAKQVACGVLAAAAIVHVIVYVEADLNPFLQMQNSDTVLSHNTASPRMRGARQPILDGIRIPQWRARALEWLAEQVRPGGTCFVYANLPSLYDLLDCTNPTRVDSTIADFPSAEDARRLAADLAKRPPDIIIAHEEMWMSPPISQDLGDSYRSYDSWNPQASFAIHRGLRAIIHRYESVGAVAEALGPLLAGAAANRRDGIDTLRVYRRVR